LRNGPFTRLNAEPLRASEYLDRAAPAGAARYYRVVVIDTSGNASSPSATVSATRPRDTAAPSSAPRSLTAVAVSGVAVDLSWLPLGDAATYRVERKGPGDADFVRVASGIVPAAYRVEGLRPGATYQFRVRGENSKGASAKVSTVTVKMPAVPAPPSDFKARRVSSTRIDLSFAAAPGASTYSVERRADGSANWVKIRTLAGSAAGFSDLNLPAGKRTARLLPHFWTLECMPASCSYVEDTTTFLPRLTIWSSAASVASPLQRRVRPPCCDPPRTTRWAGTSAKSERAECEQE